MVTYLCFKYFIPGVTFYQCEPAVNFHFSLRDTDYSFYVRRYMRLRGNPDGAKLFPIRSHTSKYNILCNGFGVEKEEKVPDGGTACDSKYRFPRHRT